MSTVRSDPALTDLDAKVRRGEKQNKDQILFEKNCKANGIDYFVVTGIDDTIKIVPVHIVIQRIRYNRKARNQMVNNSIMLFHVINTPDILTHEGRSVS